MNFVVSLLEPKTTSKLTEYSPKLPIIDTMHNYYQPRSLQPVRKDRIRNNVLTQSIKRNPVYSALALCVALFLIPIGTHSADLKNKSPQTQTNIQILCYVLMAGVGGYNYLKQSSSETKLQYWNIDRLANTTHALNTLAERHRVADRVGAIKGSAYVAPDLNSLPISANPFTWNNTLAPQGSIAAQMYQESGYDGSLGPQTAAIPVQATIDTGHMGTAGSLSVASKGVTGHIDLAYDYISDRKQRNNLNLLIFGDTGDNKTTMMQYAYHRWLRHNPSLVTMVADRKYHLGAGNKHRSVWSGLPVYDKRSAIAGVQTPVSHVLTEFVPDLYEWLEPVWSIFQHRLKGEAPSADPLYNPVTKKPREILIILDDATTILGAIEKKYGTNDPKYVNLLARIDDICVLGRAMGISIWFISHSATKEATKMTTLALSMMNPLVGATFCGDNKQLSYARGQVQPVGIQKALESAGTAVRGFATTWSRNPYIPPAPLPDGTQVLVNAEMVVQWYFNAPKGARIMPHHRTAVKAIGFNPKDLGSKSLDDHRMEMQAKKTLSEEKAADVDGDGIPDYNSTDAPARFDSGIDVETTATIINLRSWWRSHPLKPDTDEVVKAIVADFKVTEQEAYKKLPTVLNLMQANPSRFAKAIWGPDATPYKDREDDATNEGDDSEDT